MSKGYALHLETTDALCSVALSNNGTLVAYKISDTPREHVALTTLYMQQLMEENAISPTNMAFVSISEGPGSYTGLRVGSSTAKGFCFGLNIPLIAINTLQILVVGFLAEYPNAQGLVCPMIDARRDEVFCGLYSPTLQPQLPDAPMLLTEAFMGDYLAQQPIHFVGSGATKSPSYFTHPNAHFYPTIVPHAIHQVALAWQAHKEAQYANLATFEPNYLKEFYSGAPTPTPEGG